VSGIMMRMGTEMKIWGSKQKLKNMYIIKIFLTFLCFFE
jgi:hypothetical protein